MTINKREYIATEMNYWTIIKLSKIVEENLRQRIRSRLIRGMNNHSWALIKESLEKQWKI